MNFRKDITINIATAISLSDALEYIQELLSYESIKYKTESKSIQSVSIPMPILSFDLRQYSKKNIFGINPFIFLSSIRITIEKVEKESLLISLRINQLRALIIYFLAVALPYSCIKIAEKGK